MASGKSRRPGGRGARPGGRRRGPHTLRGKKAWPASVSRSRHPGRRANRASGLPVDTACGTPGPASLGGGSAGESRDLPHRAALRPGPARPRGGLWAAALLVSLAIFLIALPFAKVPLTPVWAFIPVYQVHVGLHGRRGRPPRGAA